MEKTEALLILFLSLQLLTLVYSKCPSDGPKLQCGIEGSNTNASECLKNPMCCYRRDSKPNCFINLGLVGVERQLNKARNVLGKPPSKAVSSKPLAIAARNLNISLSEKAQIEGRFGSSSSMVSSVAAFGFPKCPLNIPLCQRLPCQPSNPLSQKSATECYKDPRCCFDAELFVHKYIFGDSYLGNSPVCYLGPTSSRFLEITRSVVPWSPFYLQPIVKIFDRYLDLNIDFNKAAQCFSANLFDIDMFRTPKCGWEGITKLECNLKGCCYNSRTNHCAYPRYLFPARFGGLQLNSGPSRRDRITFPELFISSTNQCAKDGMSSEPNEVFRRLPCAQNPDDKGSSASNSIIQLYRSCPTSCCKNIMALFPGVGDITLNGSPSRVAFLRSEYRMYLSNPLMNQVLINLFCPYYYRRLRGLPDLSDSVRGCCKQTSCYHKNLNFIGGAEWGQWTSWSVCNAPCGIQGQKSRQRYCMKDNQIMSTSQCLGGSSTQTKQCTGVCLVTPYNWGPWTSYGPCSVSCGGVGTKSRTRSCLTGNNVKSNNCPGPEFDTVKCEMGFCPPQTCQWSQWEPSGPCSITCRQKGSQAQGGQVFKRKCIGQMTCMTGCPGTNIKTEPCTARECVPQYSIEGWTEWSRCGSDCMSTRRQICRQDNGQEVDMSLCSGSRESKSCDYGLCVPDQPWVEWSSWSKWGQCSGPTKTRHRRCLYKGNPQTPIGDDICTYVHKNNPVQEQNCVEYKAPVTYSWSSWTNWTRCSGRCSNGYQSRSRYCAEASTGKRVSLRSLCGKGYVMENKNCFDTLFCFF